MAGGIFSMGAVGKKTSGSSHDKNGDSKPKLAPKNQGRFKYNKYIIDRQTNGQDFVTYEEFQEGNR